MGKKLLNVKVIRGQRLKHIQIEQSISNKWLAEKLHISEPVISDIRNGRANLTEDNAARIIEIFPQYRLPWLLGIDGFKTEAEYETYKAELDKRDAEMYHNFVMGIRQVADYCGFETVIDNDGMTLRTSGLSSVQFSPISVDRKIYDEFEEDVIDFFSRRLRNLVKRGH